MRMDLEDIMISESTREALQVLRQHVWRYKAREETGEYADLHEKLSERTRNGKLDRTKVAKKTGSGSTRCSTASASIASRGLCSLFIGTRSGSCRLRRAYYRRYRARLPCFEYSPDTRASRNDSRRSLRLEWTSRRHSIEHHACHCFSFAHSVVGPAIFRVHLRHGGEIQPLNWSRVRRHQTAVVAFHNWLRVARAPDMHSLDPLMLKRGEHSLQVRQCIVENFGVAHAVQRICIREVFGMVYDVSTAVSLGRLKIRVLDHSNKRERRVIHVEPIGLRETAVRL